VGGGGTLVAEPQGNDSNVDARLQHVRCGRVSHDMGEM
jgi:hypothetical protein